MDETQPNKTLKYVISAVILLIIIVIIVLLNSNSDTEQTHEGKTEDTVQPTSPSPERKAILQERIDNKTTTTLSEERKKVLQDRIDKANQ